LSSAILYLAIVAIWAVVLVPRWLRPRSAAPKPVPVPAESPDVGWRESAGPGQDAGAPLAVSTDGPDPAGEPVGGEVMASSDAGGEDVAAVADVAREGAPEGVGPSPVNRRAEVLKARRRLLSTLITLTVIAIALVVTRIDAYWIVIPPTALLGGYLALLRKFAHIDAEQARRAARIRRAEARAETGQEPAAPLPAAPTAAEPELGSAPDAPGPRGGAEIIDISGRIGDQVYDQYSDAANRAVGD
jgi:hypothetical protein